MLSPQQQGTAMVLKGFSYAMIAAFAAGLAFTILGTSHAMIGL